LGLSGVKDFADFPCFGIKWPWSLHRIGLRRRWKMTGSVELHRPLHRVSVRRWFGRVEDAHVF